MTTTRRTTKTPEQRQAEAEALHATFAAKVEELRDSDEWARMLAAAAHLHRYSLGNLLLIWAQCPQARDVRTFAAWKKEGRAVVKGERAIKINRPVTIKGETETDAKGEPKMRTIFRPMPVFDISQTAPIDGTASTDPTEYRVLDGADDGQVFEAVAAWLEAQGWSVERSTETGSAEGDANGRTRTVRIAAHLSPAGAALTILHEAAHVALGHCEPGTDDEYRTHRGRFEVAAESVAYVAAAALGIDSTAASVPYVAGWAEGPAGTQAIRETAADVIAAAHRIIEAVEAQRAEAAAEAA